MTLLEWRVRLRTSALRFAPSVVLVLSATAVLLGLLVEARTRAVLAFGVERLQAGDLQAAAKTFEAMRYSPFQRSRGRAGRALVSTLLDRPVASGRIDLAHLPLRQVLDAALAQADPERLGRTAELASAAGSPLGRLYRAAATVEAGDVAEADEQLAALDATLRHDPLAGRIAAAVRARAAGFETLVFDRRGEPVGGLDESGALQLVPGLDETLIPRAALGPLARAPRAAGVRLSIDLDLAWLARGALREHRGSIVLLDAWTGSVLAAVSDARTSRDHETPALEQYREPASIAKLITTAAALRAGLDPDAEISRISCDGAVRYPTGTLWCPWGDGALHGLDHAMAVSCNTSFARLGARVGREGLLDEFRRWGFDRAALDLPGSGHIVAPEGDDRQLGDLAIGLEATDITPLHAALMAAVFANGGSMPAPRFVTAVDGRLGKSPATLVRREARRVIPEAWLPRLRKAMLAVAAPGGTAAFLAPPGFPVAMKTGTASLWGAGYHVNYIGIGPMPEARLAFEVRITHAPNSPRVRRAAREVTQTLLEGLEGRAHRLRSPGPADPARVPGDETLD